MTKLRIYVAHLCLTMSINVGLSLSVSWVNKFYYVSITFGRRLLEYDAGDEAIADFYV